MQIASLDREILDVIEQGGLTSSLTLLMSLPGVQQVGAAAILAETGANMSVFPDAGHLSSWAGVAPGNKISGGKAKPAMATRGNRWLRNVLVECAWGASKMKNCPLKEQFARLAPKGRKKALVAVAHSLTVVVYRALATGESWCSQPNSVREEAKKERLIRHYIRRLGKLGVQVCAAAPPKTRVNRTPSGTVVVSGEIKTDQTNPPPLPHLGSQRPSM